MLSPFLAISLHPVMLHAAAASSRTDLDEAARDAIDRNEEGLRGALEFTRGKAESPDSETLPRRPGVLLLDIKVNGEPLPESVTAEVLDDGTIALPEDIWKAANLRLPSKAVQLLDGTRGYVLEQVPGIRIRLDMSRLALDIVAPAAAFGGTHTGLAQGRPLPPPHSPPGGFVNYNFSATRTDNGALSYGGLVDAVLFNDWGSLVNRMVIRGNNQDKGFEAIRTETYWQKDLPGRLERIVIGDTVSSDGGWSQSVRFGGVRYGRDFGLAPTFITFPVPSISGSAALPSTIDVLVNNSKRQSGVSVAPGAFSITGLPVTTGAGQVNLIVTDLRGVQTVLTRDYYASARLLAPGLSDYAFEAGALRTNFGTQANTYGPAFVSASWRQGVTPGLTLQGRIEAQELRQAIGAEAVFKLGNLALARGAVSYASGHLSPNFGPDRGWHYLLSLERSTGLASFSAEWEHFDQGFEQFGNYATSSHPRDRLRVGGASSLVRGLTLGASYIDQSSWEGERYRIISGNLTLSLPEGLSLGAFAADQLSDRRGWSMGITLSKALGRQRSASLAVNRSADGTLGKYLSVSQSAPVGPGTGWRIDASDTTGHELRAGVTLNTDVTQLNADVQFAQGFNAIRLGASGAIGWMKGLPFASREIDGSAFAVVKVGDLPGIRVYRSNQYAARTNRHGLALVTGLFPYQENRITIEADELPFNVEIGGTERQAIPYARAGVFVDFAVKRSLNALVQLRSGDGQPLPVGSRVRTGGREFIVGKRGEAYLTDLSASNTLDISWAGGDCRVRVAIDPKAQDEARIGPIICGGKP